MKKRVLASMVASVLALSAAQAFAADSTNLRMSWWGGNGRHQVTLKALEEFQKQTPGVQVKSEYTGWEGHLSRLTTQIAGRTEPDMMQTNWNWLPIFSKTGEGFYDLNTLGDVIDLSQFNADDLKLSTVKGKLNGIPYSVTARVFYYNDQTWKQAGLEYPKTWDELVHAGTVFRDKLGDNYYPMVLEHFETLALLNSWMIQKYNEPMIDLQNSKLAWSHDKWVEFFTQYKHLVDSHVLPSSKYFASFGKANLYEMKPWINGEWGGIYMWNSTLTKYSGNLKPPAKLELGPYLMLPGATDAGLFFKPAAMFSVGKTSKNPQEAGKLINFLLNEREGIITLGMERGVPLSKKAFAILTEEGVIKEDDPTVAGMRQINALPRVQMVPPYFEDPQLYSLFSDTIQNIDYGNKTVEEAATSYQKEANRILKRAMR